MEALLRKHPEGGANDPLADFLFMGGCETGHGASKENDRSLS
jgi:hypothetical protein